MGRARGGQPHVLVFTYSGDTVVPELVLHAVERRGARCLRIDTDRYPQDASLTIEDDAGARGVLTVGQGIESAEVDLSRVSAAWCRRLWPATAPTEVEPRFAAASAVQARAGFFGALATLELDARLINVPAAEARAEHKPLQLRVAAAAGLRVPPTVVSNDPDAVRVFLERQERVVTKLLTPLSQSADASGPAVYTSRVDAHDARALDGLRFAPQIFQALVDKVREVRVMAVGPRLFAGAVDVGADAPLDWRVPRPDALRWDKLAVPRGVAAGIARVQRALRLTTGAYDFVVDRAGVWWFLEVNPAGEWGFLERDAGLPIARALAAELAP